MNDLPPALLNLAKELRVHRHLVQELRRTAQGAIFPHLPPAIQDRHLAFTARHEAAEADLRRTQAERFPDPGLVEAVVGYLERQGEPEMDLPASWHLRTLKEVMLRYRPDL